MPWFIKDGREDLIERFNIPLDEYPRRCERQIAEWAALRDELEGGAQIGTERSDEYGADIIRACETGEPFAFNGNVPNRRRRAADRQPARPTAASRCRASRRRHGHRAAAGRRAAAPARRADADQRQRPGADRRGGADRPPRAVYQAAMLDPHTAAELSLDEIHALVDDLLEAHGDWIPNLQAWRSGPRLSTINPGPPGSAPPGAPPPPLLRGGAPARLTRSPDRHRKVERS